MKVREGVKRPTRKRYPPWRPEEDERLRQVRPHGRNFRWFALEGLLPGRTAKQIRERWINQIDPSVSHAAWSEEEDWRIFLCHTAFGGRWSAFRMHFRGRTDNQLKNRWNSALQPRVSALGGKLLQLVEEGPLSPASPLLEDRLIAQVADKMPLSLLQGKASRMSDESTKLPWNCEPLGEKRGSPLLASYEVSGRSVADSANEDVRTLTISKNFWARADFYPLPEGCAPISFI